MRWEGATWLDASAVVVPKAPKPPTVCGLDAVDALTLAGYVPKPPGLRRALASSFFRDEDLAPPGGLPPPGGYGGGNDSTCETCACSEGKEEAEEAEAAEDAYRNIVVPNVPHHSFYPHRRGYRLSYVRILGLFFTGLGCGYAAAAKTQ
ncbi:unnamed protein product, partial [Effrenium voratum]